MIQRKCSVLSKPSLLYASNDFIQNCIIYTHMVMTAHTQSECLNDTRMFKKHDKEGTIGTNDVIAMLITEHHQHNGIELALDKSGNNLINSSTTGVTAMLFTQESSRCGYFPLRLLYFPVTPLFGRAIRLVPN